MKKKCLLIGGAGFIGQNLAIHLIDTGYKVTVLDFAEDPFTDNIERKPNYIKGDYFKDTVDKDILIGQDMVILLACSVGPKTSMDNPGTCYGQDILSMISLLDSMKELNIKRCVFISSGGTVYGEQSVEALKEDMPTFPINHYGIMKLTQEKILMMYNTLYHMNNIIFRLANPYGPGQRISSGIGAVTVFLNNVLKGEKIYIYGKGEVVRDYIYIEDAVKMIRLFLDVEPEQYKIPVFNIGTGCGNSLMQIIRIIENVTGRKAEIEYLAEREIDVHRNVLDVSKIFSVIGAFPCLSLEEGIKKYCEFME